MSWTIVDFAEPVAPMMPIVSPLSILKLTFSRMFFSASALYLKKTFRNSMLPSAGESEASPSSSEIAGTALKISPTRLTEALAMTIVTKAMSIVISDDMT